MTICLGSQPVTSLISFFYTSVLVHRLGNGNGRLAAANLLRICQTLAGMPGPSKKIEDEGNSCVPARCRSVGAMWMIEERG
jgi:hypothetical protein